MPPLAVRFLALPCLALSLAFAADSHAQAPPFDPPVFDGDEFATLGGLNGEYHWSRPANWVEFINGVGFPGNPPVNDRNRGINFQSGIWSLDLGADGTFAAVDGEFEWLGAFGGDFRLLGDPMGMNPPSLEFSRIYVGYALPAASTRLTFDALPVVSDDTTVVDGRDPLGLAGGGNELSLINGASLVTSEVALRDWAFLNLEAGSRLEIQANGSLTLDAGNAFESGLSLISSTLESGPVELEGVRGEALRLTGTSQVLATDFSIVTASAATAFVGSDSTFDLRSSGSGGIYSGGIFRLATEHSGSVDFDLEGSLEARVVELDGNVTFDAGVEGRLLLGTVRLEPVDADDTAALDVRNGAQVNVHGRLETDRVGVTGPFSRLAATQFAEIVAGSLETDSAQVDFTRGAQVDLERLQVSGTSQVTSSRESRVSAGEVRIDRAAGFNEEARLTMSGSGDLGDVTVGYVEEFGAPVNGLARLDVIGAPAATEVLATSLGIGVDYEGSISTTGQLSSSSDVFQGGGQGFVSLTNNARVAVGIGPGSTSNPFVALADDALLRVGADSSLTIGDFTGRSYRPGWVVVTGDASFGGTGTFFDGILAGRGTVETPFGGVDQRDGIVSPGLSAGTLTIEGDYTLSGGSIVFEIGGTRPGVDYDQLSVTGDILLESGVVELTRLGDYVSDGLTEFTLFTGFDSITLGPDVVFEFGEGILFEGFDPATGAVRVAAIPEPSTFAGLALGLGALAASRRRLRGSGRVAGRASSRRSRSALPR